MAHFLSPMNLRRVAKFPEKRFKDFGEILIGKTDINDNGCFSADDPNYDNKKLSYRLETGRQQRISL